MRNYAVLFFAVLLFHLAGTWNLPLIDRDEPRFAEASREMRQRDDFVVPYFNNQYRFDKPPLTYWCQVLSYRVFGENDFAARFATAVAAALSAVVLLAWGTRMGDVRTGWWAAAIFTLCLQTFIHGKAAVADMWLVLFVTVAHWAGWEMLGARSAVTDRHYRPCFFWIFYVALAFAFLAKGPIGWMPLLTLGIARRFFPGVAVAEDGRQLQRFDFIIGILLMMAIVCAWGIPALVRTDGEFLKIGIGKHVIGRSVATMEGHGANSFVAYLALLPFYFVTIFASFFPWSVKLPALWKNLRRQRDATDNSLLIGVLIIFGIFTLVKTKLPHYTLPAFPLIALLMARRAEQLRLSRRLVWLTATVLILVSLIAPPLIARFVPSYNLASKSRAELRPNMEFGAVDYTEPSLVWYFRRTVSGFMTPLRNKDAVTYLGNPGSRFLIMPTDSVARFFPQIDPSWHTYRMRGWNMAKGERVDVTMLLKEQ
ncbi:MAG: ArnT family glycosyltransferase [Chthoniobacterales bacterium]